MSKQHPLTVSSYTLGTKVTFEERVIAAKNAGYEGIGLRAENYIAALQEGLHDEDILNINVSKNISESINIFKKNIVLLIHNDVIKERVIRKIKLNGGNILNNIEEESVDLIVYQPHSKINEILEKAKKENIKVMSLGIFNKMIMS